MTSGRRVARAGAHAFYAHAFYAGAHAFYAHAFYRYLDYVDDCEDSVYFVKDLGG